MFFKHEETIPRIHVMLLQGKVSCILDKKLQQRFGSVLLHSNKQGRHLFSISYCISSLAAKYCVMADREIVNDIVSRFHPDFLTQLIINAKYVGTNTHFLKNWELHFDDLARQHEELKSLPKGQVDEHTLDIIQSYLNLVGVMLHTLPCNVAFSHNASDPKGGNNAMRACSGISAIINKGSASSAVNSNIALAVDHDAINELFKSGFDDNNVYLLASMILQIQELQSIQDLRRPNNSNVRPDRLKIETDLSEIIFRFGSSRPPAHIVSKAIEMITTIRRDVVSRLSLGDKQWIRRLIQNKLDQTYSFKTFDR